MLGPERRQDNYDELLILARDARASRTRSNRWTTGIIGSAMLATAAYVVTTNQQVNNLAEEGKTAGANVTRLENQVSDLQRERDSLEVERNVYKENAQWFANIAPTLKLGDSIQYLGDYVNRGRPDLPSTAASTPMTLVWLVEGSRRFPMAENDILWIPEANYWVKLDNLTNENITLYRQNPATSNASGTPDQLPKQLSVNANTSRVACLILHYPSRRPGFGVGYADMEVLLQTGDCVFPPSP